ncbi:MAG: helix-turn-helix transcriptional regulator [Firmicutes bacterium]|nr:helix-turn-helix transcriptional regulator [Bacillota bacterium]
MSDPFLTCRIRDEIERAEELSELERLLDKYASVFQTWPEVLRRLMTESGLSYVRLAERTGISRNTLRRWAVQGGAPRCRSAYVRLGFGFLMDSARTNELLSRHGGYQPLYPRDLFDAVCIFLLDRQQHTYAEAEALYAQCQALPREDAGENGTAYARRQLGQFLDREEFLLFVEQHRDLFRRPHRRLQEHVSQLLRARGHDTIAGKPLSVHGMFAAEGIPSRFEKDISNLLVHGLTPRRERLIALGIHLGLLHDGIDRLLAEADMEPLCAKNRVECVVIYVLQQLSLAHPELSLEHAARMLAVTDDAETEQQIRRYIREFLAADYHSESTDCLTAAGQLRTLLQRLAPEEAEQLLTLI